MRFFGFVFFLALPIINAPTAVHYPSLFLMCTCPVRIQSRWKQGDTGPTQTLPNPLLASGRSVAASGDSERAPTSPTLPSPTSGSIPTGGLAPRPAGTRSWHPQLPSAPAPPPLATRRASLGWEYRLNAPGAHGSFGTEVPPAGSLPRAEPSAPIFLS